MTETKRTLGIEDAARAGWPVRRGLAATCPVVVMFACGDETTFLEAMKALRAPGDES